MTARAARLGVVSELFPATHEPSLLRVSALTGECRG